MSQEHIKLNATTTKKVDEILKNARRDFGMLMVKNFFIGAAFVIPIILLSAALSLLNTAFPMISVVMTALFVQHRYTIPKSRKIGEFYAKQVKEAIEEGRNHPEEG